MKTSATKNKLAPTNRQIVMGLWWRILMALILIGLWIILALMGSKAAMAAADDWGRVREGASGALPVAIEGGFGSMFVVYQGGDYGFVSETEGIVTLFEAAWRDGSMGFLAHNYLAGYEFYGVEVGDLLRVRLADGSVERFAVREVAVFLAVEPGAEWTDVVDESGRRLTQEQVYELMYEREGWTILQTCVGGVYEGWWFAAAEPVEYEQVWLTMVWN